MARGVEVQLFDEAGAALSSLAVKVLWLEGTAFDPYAVMDLVPFAASATTDGSGWLKLDLSKCTGRALGEEGFLVVYKEDLSDYQNALVFASIMEIVDVTGGTDAYPPLPASAKPNWWPTLPPIGPSDQKALIVFAVTDGGFNTAYLKAEGDYEVDWGDGTQTTHLSGTTASHTYDFADVDLPAATPEGWKAAIITVTPDLAANLTLLDLAIPGPERSAQYSHHTNFIEMVIAGPLLTTLWVGVSTEYNVFTSPLRFFSLLSFAGTSLDYLLYSSGSLQEVYLNCQGVTSIYSLLSSTHSLRRMELVNTGSVLDATEAFAQVGVKVLPPISFPAATTVLNLCSGAKFMLAPALSFPAALTCSRVLASAESLLTCGGLSAPLSTNFSQAFQGCHRLVWVGPIDCSAATTISGMFSNCRELRPEALNVTLTSALLNASEFIYSSGAEAFPSWLPTSVTNLSYSAAVCSKLKEVGNLLFPSATDATEMFTYSTALAKVGSLTFHSSCDTRGIFNGCASLYSIGAVSFGSQPADESVWVGGRIGDTKLTSLAAVTAFPGRSFVIKNSYLTAAALNAVYTALPSVSGKTIWVTGNPGVTGDDPSIATSKGWTVVS